MPIPRFSRIAVVAALAAATVASSVLGATANGAASAASASAASASAASASAASASAKPGLVGAKVLLQAHASFSGYDAATDAAGNTYVGWIGDSVADSSANRTIYLCTIPVGQNACEGGVRSTPSLDVANSAGLRLLVTPGGLVTMVWSLEAAVPEFKGRDGRIATTTSQSGGPLTPATLVADAPTYGELRDAELAPNGALWTVVAVGAGSKSIEVREGVQNPPITVGTPYAPGAAYLAFSGSTPVIAIQKYGSIFTPPAYTHGVGGGFAHWRNLNKAWTAGGNIGLVATKTGVRVVSSVANADYYPQIAKYSGGVFGTSTRTGDRNNCAPSTHDLNTDASGRLVDVSEECHQLAVASMPGTTVAGIFRFTVPGTFADGIPQITTTPRGHGVIVWGTEGASAGGGDSLYFNRILLPGRDTSVTRSGVTVSGPISCQPASRFAASVKGHRAGWTVASAKLTLNGSTLASKATVDGAGLKPGKVYTLVGKVVFAKGGAHRSGTARLKFRSCINP